MILSTQGKASTVRSPVVVELDEAESVLHGDLPDPAELPDKLFDVAFAGPRTQASDVDSRHDDNSPSTTVSFRRRLRRIFSSSAFTFSLLSWQRRSSNRTSASASASVMIYECLIRRSPSKSKSKQNKNFSRHVSQSPG